MAKTKKFNLTELLNQQSMEEAGKAETDRQESVSVEEAARTEEIVMVDVHDLEPSRENFYQVDDSLKRSVELVGILQPLLVDRPRNGKYRVIAGHRRRLAVLSLVEEGKEERRYVPCVLKKEDVKDRLALVMANRFRDKTDWEKMMEAVEAEGLAKELKKDYRLGGRTRQVLAEIMGMSEAQLGRYKSIYNNLDPELMEQFRAGVLGFSAASELCGMPGECQDEAKKQIREKGTVSLPEIQAMKKNRAVPVQEKGEEETRTEKAQETGEGLAALLETGERKSRETSSRPGKPGQPDRTEPSAGKPGQPDRTEPTSGLSRQSDLLSETRGTGEERDDQKNRDQNHGQGRKNSIQETAEEPASGQNRVVSGSMDRSMEPAGKAPMTTGEMFQGICGRLKAKGKLPNILDYGLADSPSVPVTGGEAELKSSLDYGGSEGIYLDLWVEMLMDGEYVTKGLGTFKTLEEDHAAMHTMAGLLADFVIEKYAYVRENGDRFLPA